MARRSEILAGVTLLLGSHDPVAKEAGPSAPFAAASVHFEQNATDRDLEVVFEVRARDEGLAKLTVVSPDGRIVIDFTAPAASTLGIRQFRLESPEPGDAESIRSAYPEGVYTFAGATAAGDKLHGESRLTHKLPPTASFLRPAPNARGVSTKGLEITWTPVTKPAGYIITIEQDALNVDITARLPASATTFAVPEGILRPGLEYQLGIGTVGDEGNVSFVETTFSTAAKQK